MPVADGIFCVVTEGTDAIARRLAAIVESSDDAIVSKDLNGIVLSWNQAAERMFGYTAEEMIGASIRRIIPDDRQSEEDTVLASIRASQRVEHFETVRKSRDGRLVPISLTVSPILDAGGSVVGASKIARDISDRKRAEQQAANASQRDAFLAEATLTLARSLDYEQTLRALARLDPEPVVWLHPDDAGQRGIGDGDAVAVYNDRGRFEAKARVTAKVLPGVVWMRDGWPGMNRVTSDVPVLSDEVAEALPVPAGQAAFDALVQVERAQG